MNETLQEIYRSSKIECEFMAKYAIKPIYGLPLILHVFFHNPELFLELYEKVPSHIAHGTNNDNRKIIDLMDYQVNWKGGHDKIRANGKMLTSSSYFWELLNGYYDKDRKNELIKFFA